MLVLVGYIEQQEESSPLKMHLQGQKACHALTCYGANGIVWS